MCRKGTKCRYNITPRGCSFISNNKKENNRKVRKLIIGVSKLRYTATLFNMNTRRVYLSYFMNWNNIDSVRCFIVNKKGKKNARKN